MLKKSFTKQGGLAATPAARIGRFTNEISIEAPGFMDSSVLSG
jgi:hypothetical protein